MKFQRLLVSLFAAGVVAIGFSTAAVAEEGADEAEEVEEVEEVEEEVAEDADREVDSTYYAVDPAHSNVLFRINHKDVGYVYGMFRKYDGSFEFDEDNIEDSALEFSIDARSIFTNHESRDEHLRSPDFFAAEEHPELTFQSTSFESHPGENAYEVTGDLTLRGITEEITIVVDETGAKWDDDRFRRGFHTNFAVNRLDYGIDFMPDDLGEYVRVTVSLQGVLQEDGAPEEEEESEDVAQATDE